MPATVEKPAKIAPILVLRHVWIRPPNVWISAPICGQVPLKWVPMTIMCRELGHQPYSVHTRPPPIPATSTAGEEQAARRQEPCRAGRDATSASRKSHSPHHYC